MKELLIFLAASFAIVVGTITDKTTGQPLVGVVVTTTAANQHLRARTDAQGHFTLGNLPAGTYTLHLSSDDVPPQTLHIQVKEKDAHLNLRACSTTLDYKCGGGSSPGGS
jgi:Carboxypeptidase regulatory-like domain